MSTIFKYKILTRKTRTVSARRSTSVIYAKTKTRYVIAIRTCTIRSNEIDTYGTRPV